MSRLVNKDTCINCGACEPTCPVDAISEVDNARYIDPAVCIDCGACEGVCPVTAISPA
ncbi:4Fe-4S binding protein [Entomospira nematocerorum]|uniref:Ferredoxin n=2 Tax=Entomospira TaxID=2834378 RepID=A0A968KV70_9SPIO|nr:MULTISPECIES: 4Fe-4S binding protein [Entomospira]NIZ40550.1 4Fe-4S binding protein [Entomospira entomophilus]NIZ46953.1 4Fe-4S binding protein [Entomospira nematocera]WDI34501.1 4Fe-4S binding protein [Entomospira nematocera]WDI36108.1 4Fe-4S binding protein [Entomospira entomophilus]